MPSMKINGLYPLCIFFLLISCNSSAPKEVEKQHEAVSYTSNEIGWSIDAPTGFKLTSKQKMAESEKKGKEAIGEVYDGDIKTDSLKHLISFQKNQLNMFDSTIEPYSENKSGSYHENNQLLKKLLFDTYTKQKIRVDTASTITEVAGQQFNIFEIKVYGPSGEIAMTQLMYSKYYKGYDFGITILYNNEIDKSLMLEALNNSKFSN